MQFVVFAFSWVLARLRSERGQDLMEYALLSGLIAAALLAILFATTLNNGVVDMASGIVNCIDFDSLSKCNPPG